MTDGVTVSLTGAVAKGDVGQATLRVRSNLSVAHIKVAAYSALQAQKVENANLGSYHGPWFDDMVMHVPVAVVMSAAAIEAAVNEWCQDVIDDPQKYGANDSQCRLVKDLIKDRTGNALSRFQKLSLYLGKLPDMGRSESSNARYLTEFRNHFMHFKPAWDDDAIHDGSLVKALKDRGVPVYQPYAENFRLPYGFMTYGCARWAVQSAADFVVYYSNAYGLEDRFTSRSQTWTLP